MRGRRDLRSFTGTNEKTKEYKGALQTFAVFSFPLAPTARLFPMLSPISFLFLWCLQCNFGRGFNKIFELCRFRRGNLAELPETQRENPISSSFYCSFLLFLFPVEALCGRAQKATKTKRQNTRRGRRCEAVCVCVSVCFLGKLLRGG